VDWARHASPLHRIRYFVGIGHARSDFEPGERTLVTSLWNDIRYAGRGFGRTPPGRLCPCISGQPRGSDSGLALRMMNRNQTANPRLRLVRITDFQSQRRGADRSAALANPISSGRRTAARADPVCP
jgi:hypothetical protein